MIVASASREEPQVDNAAKPTRIHHVALAVNDPAVATEWYRDVLGLVPVERPAGATADGSWFQLGDAQVHLFEPVEPHPGQRPVAPPHFAVEVADLAATLSELRLRGVTVYEGDHVQGFGYQAMVLDPSGNLIELNQPD